MIDKILLLAVMAVSTTACHNENNSDHNYTKKICGNLYIESYTTFGIGAGGGSMLGNCLTDSASFRVFVGIYDEGNEGINYKCIGDSLNIKMYKSERSHEKSKTHETNSYSLQELKNLKNYSYDSYFRFSDLEQIEAIN